MADHPPSVQSSCPDAVVLASWSCGVLAGWQPRVIARVFVPARTATILGPRGTAGPRRYGRYGRGRRTFPGFHRPRRG